VTTVVICDTEPIAIAGVQSLVENVEDVSVVRSESSLSGGIDAVRDLSPSLLIVDKGLGSQAVMDWISGLRVSDSRTTVMVWGNSISESEAVRFLQAGASGIARKTAGLPTLLRCILTTSSGGTWMDEGLSPESSRPVRLSSSPLTVRELQVMDLVERGFKNKEIGSSLGIQTGTVKIHLKHIFEKTGIRGRYGLAISGLKEKGMLAMAAETPN
jgi:two-component system, NarL family, nitrate/nitrite response regulator NarL